MATETRLTSEQVAAIWSDSQRGDRITHQGIEALCHDWMDMRRRMELAEGALTRIAGVAGQYWDDGVRDPGDQLLFIQHLAKDALTQPDAAGGE